MPFQFGVYQVSDDAITAGSWALAKATDAEGKPVRLGLLRWPQGLPEADQALISEMVDRAVAACSEQTPRAGCSAVVDGGQMEGGVYLVETPAGKTLAESVADSPLSARDLVALLQSLASTIDSLHAAGVTHPWLSPHNIVVGGSSPVVAGALWASILARLQAACPFAQWPDGAFAAPEVRQGGSPDARAEAYSGAALAAFAATGHTPDPGLDLSHLPPAIAAAIGKGLEADPALRYASFKEMVVDVTVEQAIAVDDQAAENAVPTGGSVPDWAADLLAQTTARREAGQPLIDTPSAAAPTPPQPTPAPAAPERPAVVPLTQHSAPPAAPPAPAAPTPEPPRPEPPRTLAPPAFDWHARETPRFTWVPMVAGAVSALFVILGLAVTILRSR